MNFVGQKLKINNTDPNDTGVMPETIRASLGFGENDQRSVVILPDHYEFYPWKDTKVMVFWNMETKLITRIVECTGE